MTRQTACKIAQLLGAIAMSVGVTSCINKDFDTGSTAWLVGGLLYGGGRLTAWFSER